MWHWKELCRLGYMEKKKKARKGLMPTPITRLRVWLLIGQTEMFPPVTKSHHPAVKHSQSATYRFTHHSYTLTCRLHRASSGRGQRISYLNQTVLQRSNTNMWSWGPTEGEAWLTSPSQTQDYHAFTLQRASDSKKDTEEQRKKRLPPTERHQMVQLCVEGRKSSIIK